MTKIKHASHHKWVFFTLLVLIGSVLLLFCPGYTFSGLFFLGLASLVPVYTWIGLLRRRNMNLGKGLHMALTIFLALFFAAIAITWGIIADASRGTEAPESEYLVVLGAGVNGTEPSRSLKERLDAAYDYLTEHPDTVAIVSGGQGSGEDITEARCMYDYLTEAGISPDRVWMEDQATSTLENLRFSLDLIEDRTSTRPAKVAVLSSEYHLYRAGMFAHWLDLEAELIPARTAMPLLRWNYYLREVFAIWKYSLFGG